MAKRGFQATVRKLSSSLSDAVKRRVPPSPSEPFDDQ